MLTKHLRTWTGSSKTREGAATAANISSMFVPHKPMYNPGMQPAQLKVKNDIPKALKNALEHNMAMIGPTCLRENAEVVLEIYEDMCLQHVLDHQIQSKTLEKLKRRDPNYEKDQKEESSKQRTPNSIVGRSSLIGRDPWGDQPLPQPEKVGDGDDADDGEYSAEQMLLIEVQDKLYSYLTAHIPLILEDSICLEIEEVEM